ncbi:MAG: hypothetical protein H6727_01350 [Myxococcales bacterium]|nr:hypothetical protein [Myxococcales bacterium]
MLFVGRRGPVAELSTWLQETANHGESVRVGSIAGPGGIGKTFLLDYCLRHTPRFSLKEQLVLRFEGQQQPRSLARLFAVEWLEQLQNQNDALPRNAFPYLTQIKEQYLQIIEQIERTLQKQGDDGLRDVTQRLLSFGVSPERSLLVRPFDLTLAALEENILEEAIRWLRIQPGLRPERQLWTRANAWKGKGLRNRLRRDLEGCLAEALAHDLGALTKQKNRPFKQLLLIFDDYESLSPIVGDFLIEHLIPKLKLLGLPTLLLFLGRDQLLATHPEWGQHHRQLLGTRQIELRPFTRIEADELMRRKGLLQIETIDRIWERTQGFPFLLDIECDDEQAGGTSALGLKLFYQRLTRWMTPIQRSWLLPLCFLDEINLETVPVMLPQANPMTILTWFKEEASLRDPHAARWQVIPFVRQRLLQYLRNDSPQQYTQWASLAKQAQTKIETPPASEKN